MFKKKSLFIALAIVMVTVALALLFVDFWLLPTEAPSDEIPTSSLGEAEGGW